MLGRRLLSITVAALALCVPTQAQASTYEVTGGLRDIAHTPGSDTLWMVKSATFDQLVSYRPGEGWTSHRPPGVQWDTTIFDVGMASESDGWAVDDLVSSTGMLRWDGTSWTRQRYDALARGAPRALSVSDPQNAWAIGHRTNQDGRVLAAAWHWNGESWQQANPPGAWSSTYEDVVSLGPTNTWIVGSIIEDGAARGAAWHWDGTGWTRTAVPDGVTSMNELTTRWASASWADGSSGYLRWDGASWHRVPAMPGSRTANGIDATTGDTLWTAIDQPPGVGRLQSSQWTIHTPPQLCIADAQVRLFDVEAVANDDVYAVGQCVSQWGTYTLALHFNGSQWERR